MRSHGTKDCFPHRDMMCALVVIVAGCRAPADPPTPAPEPPACVDDTTDVAVVGTVEDAAALGAIVATGRVAAVSVGVARGDETTWLSAQGQADPAARRAATTDTPFLLASATKAWVAVLVMTLVDDGLVDLDADVRTLSPALAGVAHPQHPDVAITPRMLLTHTSSLWDLPFTFDATHTTIGDASLPMREFVAGYFDDRSAYFGGADAWWEPAPGTFSCYSNMGFGVLGVVIEDVGGGSLAALLEDRVIAPLRLAHTSFRADAFCDDVLVQGVRADDNGGFVDDNIGAGPQPEGHPELASGMLKSSAADMLTFARALARGGVADDGTRLLSSRAFEAMITRQLSSEIESCGDGRSDPAQQALGVVHFPDAAGRDWIGHYGGMNGATSAVWFEREARHAYTIVQNVLDTAVLNDVELLVLAHMDRP
jgi:CubicO group peptidase (beta-lactamase class C family)